MDRRSFLSAAAAGVALSAARHAHAVAAPATKRVGLIGTGWYGKCDLLRLIQVAPVEVVSLCDPDQKMLAEAAELVAQRQASKRKPRTFGDYRQLLKEKDLDIVIIGTPIESLETPEPTETNAPGGFTFMRQSDPQAISINLYDASRGCGWMGVAGRVVDEQNRPVTGIRVWLRGTLDGKRVDMTSLTGTAAQYGPSGYEFTIANQPLESRGSLSVRLLDQANLPLSERVVFDTFADCEKNLILIDFKKVR